MKKLNIKNEGLTGYYLEQKLKYYSKEETGLEFIYDEEGEEKEEIVLHYEDELDLEKKFSFILMILTDK